MKAWQIWKENKEQVTSRLVAGEELEGYSSGFGDNDLIIGFLMVEGFWDVLKETEADLLRKSNGYAPHILNGLWMLCELAGVERVAQSGRVIGDGSLLRMAGFQAEQIEKASGRKKLRVDPETLSNHLSRVSEDSVERSWAKHLDIIRGKWDKGGVYGVDGTTITIPYGQMSNYEGAGAVGEAKGYKLVVVFNIDAGHERVIGWALGGLGQSERTLLRKILNTLQMKYGELDRWIKVLTFDRGYWGAEFLAELKEAYGVEYVTRAGHDKLGWVNDIEGRSHLEDTMWHCTPEHHSRLGEMVVHMAGFKNIPLIDSSGKTWGQCNGVMADEYDTHNHRLAERPRFYYATSLPINPAHKESIIKIRNYYRQRWSVENQGFWVLTKRWNLDTLVGRNLNAIRARLNFALQLYNAENCCANKHPGSYDEELHRLYRPAHYERLGRPSIMVYTDDGYITALQVKEYSKLIRAATEHMVRAQAHVEIKQELKETISNKLHSGEDIRDILHNL